MNNSNTFYRVVGGRLVGSVLKEVPLVVVMSAMCAAVVREVDVCACQRKEIAIFVRQTTLKICLLFEVH